MLLSNNVRSSLTIILSHKIRTLLTLLGLIIGVLAVVSIFSAVDGVKVAINTSVGNMGWDNSFTVTTKSDNEDDYNRWWVRKQDKREAKPININDFYTLKENLNAKHIYSMVSTSSHDRNSKFARWTRIKATNTDYFDFKKYSILQGRIYNNIDERQEANVCLIGNNFWENSLNSDPNIIGKKLTLGDYRYNVIGIIGEIEDEKKSIDFNSWERRWDMNAIFIPLATGVKYFSPNQEVETIYVQSEDANQFLYNRNKARQLLLINHNMTESFKFVEEPEEILKFTQQLNDMLSKWNTILMAIASVSLFVGGIGLFSTLLISISERMNEIGIRKSVGASEFDIFSLLLSEAIILTLIGAAIGISLAKLIVVLISKAMNVALVLPFKGVLVGLGFALLIGVVSGLYPAYKAAKVNPIEAVYYFD